MARHLLIPVGFMWSLGIFSVLYYLHAHQHDGTHSKFTAEELRTIEMSPSTLMHYTDSLIDLRRKQVHDQGIYDPYLYFHDEKQFEMFRCLYQDSLQKSDLNGQILLNTYSGALTGSRYHELMNLSLESYRSLSFSTEKKYNGTFSEHSNGLHKPMTFPEAHNYWYPAEAARNLAKSKEPPFKFWNDLLIPVLKWLLGAYLKGLPFAFLLFIIWRLKLKDDYQEEVWESQEMQSFDLASKVQPLSFIVSLLLWPAILWMDIQNRLSNILYKAEVLSRRKNMLSLLSESDQKLIQLGHSMSLKDFRAHLESIGMTRKHSFASALVVTLLLIIVPHITHATVHVSNTTHHHLTITTIDYGDTHSSAHTFHTAKTHYEIPVLLDRSAPNNLLAVLVFHFFNLASKIHSGFTRDIRGVPKFTHSLQF